MSTIDKIIFSLKQQHKKQKDLTDFLGISKNSFTDWKSGRIKSYNKYLPEIAEFLGVSVDYLVGRSNTAEKQKNSPTDNDEGVSNNIEQFTVYAYEGTFQGAKTVEVNSNTFAKLNELVKTAQDLPVEKIEALIATAKAMK